MHDDYLHWSSRFDYREARRAEYVDCSGLVTFTLDEINQRNRREHKIIPDRGTVVRNFCGVLVAARKLKERQLALS